MLLTASEPQVLLGIVSKTTMQGCGYNAQAPTFTTSNKDTDPAKYYDDIYLGCVCFWVLALSSVVLSSLQSL